MVFTVFFIRILSTLVHGENETSERAVSLARASTFRHVSPGRESRLQRFRSHIFSSKRRSRVRNSAFARFIFSVYICIIY